MARLPEPGKDAGQWGDVLNDFLSQSIADDGSLRADTVGSSQLKPNAVTGAAIADGHVTGAKIAAGAVGAAKIQDGAIGSNQLADNAVTMPKIQGAGQASGLATLDADARLLESQIPERLRDATLTSKIVSVGEDEGWGSGGTGTAEGSVGGSRLTVLSSIDKSRSSNFTLMLYGMSIAQAQASPAKVLGALLQRQYGSPWGLELQGFLLGGSYGNTVQGWRKQRFSGPGYGRARGGSDATALTYSFYGDTVVIDYSCEANSEAANILIDGAVVGTSPAAGAQAFAVRRVFTVATGVHTVTVSAATGSGFVYWERLRAFDSALHGVHVIDNTLGGSTLGGMLTAASAESGQVATIPTVGEAGLLAHFDRDDVDAFVLQHDVNDAGSSPTATYVEATFLPLLNRIVEITRARRKPLLLISSMAGHYALPVKGGGTQQHLNYERIRAEYRAAAANNNHVTHIDWHAATAMADLVAYAARYYPVVTGLNPMTGTWNGEDFIHPVQQGHSDAQQLVAKALELPAPTKLGSVAIREDTMRALSPTTAYPPQRSLVAARTFSIASADGATDTVTASAAHGLAVGDRIVLEGNITGVVGGKVFWVQAVPSATTFRLSETSGGTLFDITASSTTARNAFVLDNRRYAMPAGAALISDSSNTIRTVPF